MADYSVTFSELSSLLQSLSANTASTPYEIEITQITNAQCQSSNTNGTLGYILKQNNTKYVSLSFSENSGLTAIGEIAFYQCLTLINIQIPSTVTSLEFICFGESGLRQVTIPAHKLQITFLWRLTNGRL